MGLTVKQAFRQGVAPHNAGGLQEAERFFRVILQTQPTHPGANHNLGLMAFALNNIGVALPLFKTVLEENPKIKQFWCSYIHARTKYKQFKDAK